MSLLKLLPTGTVLKHLDKDCRYIECFEVIDGGYATHEVAKFIHDGKPLYFNLAIADSQFGLQKLLDDCMSRPFSDLSKDMQKFVATYFNSSNGGAA